MLLWTNIIVILATHIDSYLDFGFEKFFLFFTDYTLFLGTISIYLTICCSDSLAKGVNASDALSLHALSHLCYSLSVLMNFVVMVVYWSLVHSSLSKEPEFKKNNYKKFMRLILPHTIPALTCTLNTSITKTTLSECLMLPFLALSVMYLGLNYR